MTEGMRIGDFASLAGVSARTLRYYEERGIFTPTGHTAGGERRYREEDAGQLKRILELRDGLGLSLDEVKAFIDSERRLTELRSAYQESSGRPEVRARLREEAIAIRKDMVERIDAKTAQLESLRRDLVAAIARSEEALAELRQYVGR
ncbi:MAG: MerR family transcriptional regulator [Candidatus Dormibacteraceae bacterium]